MVEVYDATGGATFVRRVIVTGGGYGTADGLAVGETRASLESVLGAPVGVEGPLVSYEADGGDAPTAVEVTYAPDQDGVERASEIVWRPYLD